MCYFVYNSAYPGQVLSNSVATAIQGHHFENGILCFEQACLILLDKLEVIMEIHALTRYVTSNERSRKLYLDRIIKLSAYSFYNSSH
jgi:hypothetical protein